MWNYRFFSSIKQHVIAVLVWINLKVCKVTTQVVMISTRFGSVKIFKQKLATLMAPPPRLERGTCGLTVRRSNQLS